MEVSDETRSSKNHSRRDGCAVGELGYGEGRRRLGLERNHVKHDRGLERVRPGALRSDHANCGVRGGQRDYRRLRAVPRHDRRAPRGFGKGCCRCCRPRCAEELLSGQCNEPRSSSHELTCGNPERPSQIQRHCRRRGRCSSDDRRPSQRWLRVAPILHAALGQSG